MFSKINILSIIKDHAGTLKNESTGRISFSDIFLFYILPLIFGSILVKAKLFLSENMINIIIASLSIFVGLLLNLLMLLMGILDKYREKINNLPSEYDDDGVVNPFTVKTKLRLNKKQTLLNETYFNISFTMLIALISIPIMILAFTKNSTMCLIANLIGYYFLTMFVLTLLMVLKRVHVILKDEN